MMFLSCDMPCRYVDQGGGKRKGAFAVYLEPWHADIFDWLNLRKNHGKEEVCFNYYSLDFLELQLNATSPRPFSFSKSCP